MISCKNERIVAIKATASDFCDMVFVCVYMLVNKPANLTLFTECLSDIVVISCKKCVIQNVCIY